MKQWIYMFTAILAIVIGSFGFLAWQLLPNDYEMLKRNWSIDLPKADDVQDLITTESSFNGDGEWFTIYSYDKKIPLTNTNLVKLTADSAAQATNRIRRFERSVLSFRADSVEPFTTHHIQALAGDYYYHTAKNEGNNYIILLYKSSTQKMYVYEWHQ